MSVANILRQSFVQQIEAGQPAFVMFGPVFLGQQLEPQHHLGKCAAGLQAGIFLCCLAAHASSHSDAASSNGDEYTPGNSRPK
jgi:hypothetical protein